MGGRWGRHSENVYARYPVVAVRYNSTDTTRQDVGSECMNKSNPKEHEREREGVREREQNRAERDKKCRLVHTDGVGAMARSDKVVWVSDFL